MATLFGIHRHTEIPGRADDFLAMQEALELPGGNRERAWIDPQGLAAIGATSASNMPDPGHLAIDEASGVVCMVDGVVFARSDSASGRLIEPDAAARLLTDYLDSGPDCLEQIEGNFSVAWWDPRYRRLVIGTDRIGQTLLFYGMHQGNFVFGSYVLQLLASGCLTREPDLEGFADLLACEFVLGDRTIFRDVRIVSPATYLVVEGQSIKARQYWRIDEVESGREVNDDYLDELTAVWRRAVRRTIRPDCESAIGLTGGVDSRMILAAAAAESLPFYCYTGGLPDSTDVLLARQAAAMTGAKHTARLVESSDADSWLEPMVRYQGGFVATLHTHPCKALFSVPGHDARVQGIGGGYVRGFWGPGAGEQAPAVSDMPDYLFDRLVAPAKQRRLQTLWQPELAGQALEATKAHVHDLVYRYDQRNGPLALAHYFYLHERCRKFLNKGVIISRLARDNYYPYLDHDYVVHVSALKIEDRLRHNIGIQVELIRRLWPRLLDIPYAKDLVPLSASGLRRFQIRLSRALRRRLNAITPIVAPPPSIVDNHDYARWIREDMKQAIVDLLRDPNAAYRNYLDRAGVIALLDEHFDGRADNKALIAALTTFEIIARQ